MVSFPLAIPSKQKGTIISPTFSYTLNITEHNDLILSTNTLTICHFPAQFNLIFTICKRKLTIKTK